MIAHRPSLFSFVDKLLVMRDGRVEKFGERQAIMAAMQPRPKVVGPSHDGPSLPPEPKIEGGCHSAGAPDLSARAELKGKLQ